MADGIERETTTWKYRLTTLGLLLAYSPSYSISPSVLQNHLSGLKLLGYGLLLHAYVVVSYTLVTGALLLAILGPRVIEAGPLRVARRFLLFNWLPHSYLAAVAIALYSSGGFIG